MRNSEPIQSSVQMAFKVQNHFQIGSAIEYEISSEEDLVFVADIYRTIQRIHRQKPKYRSAFGRYFSSI